MILYTCRHVIAFLQSKAMFSASISHVKIRKSLVIVLTWLKLSTEVQNSAFSNVPNGVINNLLNSSEHFKVPNSINFEEYSCF